MNNISDLIRRKSIKNLLCDLNIDNISVNDKRILEYIDELPTVDAVPVVHTKWIAQNDALTRFMCSNCKSENHEGFETYCPKCGALMDLR